MSSVAGANALQIFCGSKLQCNMCELILLWNCESKLTTAGRATRKSREISAPSLREP